MAHSVTHSPTPWAISDKYGGPNERPLICEEEGPDKSYVFTSCYIEDANGAMIGTFEWANGQRGGYPRCENYAEFRGNLEMVVEAVNTLAAERAEEGSTDGR